MPTRDSPEVLERIRANLRLVEIIARQIGRQVGSIARVDDLVSAGREGLLEAARRFDPERGVPFPRFANYRVRGAMIDYVRKVAPVPRRAYEKLRALEAAALVAEVVSADTAPGGLGSPVGAEAEKVLASHLADMATAMAVGLLAARAHGEEEGEQIAVADDPSPEEHAAMTQLRGVLRAAVAELPDDERALIEGHYLRGVPFDQISASLGLSKSWGSRLHSRAVRRLTEKLRPPAEPSSD